MWEIAHHGLAAIALAYFRSVSFPCLSLLQLRCPPLHLRHVLPVPLSALLPLVSDLLTLHIPSDPLPASNLTVRPYLWAIAATVPDLTSFVTCSSVHILVHTVTLLSFPAGWGATVYIHLFRSLQVWISTCLSSPPPLELSVCHAIAYHDFLCTKYITFVTWHKQLF